MGVGEAATDSKAIDCRARPARHHRPAADDHPCPQVHRYLPPARWYAHRLQGYPAWRPYVEFFDRLTSVAIPVSATSAASPPRASTAVVTSPWASPSSSSSPKVDFDSVDHQRGMDITFVTTAKTDEEAKALLDAFGFPFKK